jgi:hypothetical protein
MDAIFLAAIGQHSPGSPNERATPTTTVKINALRRQMLANAAALAVARAHWRGIPTAKILWEDVSQPPSLSL